MDLSKLAQWEYDVATDLFTFDDQFYALLGTSTSEQGGNQMSSGEYATRFPPPEEKAVVAREIEIALEATDPDFIRRLEHRIIRADGQERYLDVSFGLEKNEAGRTIKVYGAVQDVTERRRAEEALEASEEKYRLVVENAAEAIFLLQDGRIKYYNQYAVHLSGYSQQEYQSMNFLEFIHPDDRARALEYHQKRMSGDSDVPNFHQLKCLHKSGEVRWTEVNIITVHWEGKPAALVFIKDITEHKQAVEDLRQSEERSRQILRTAMDGFCRTDSQGRLLEVNEAYCRMTGYKEQEMLAMSIAELEAIETPRDVAARMRILMEKGEGRFETKHRRKDGSLFDVEISAQYQQANDAGECVAFVRDITERKKTEIAILDFHARLAQVLEFLPDATFAIDTQGKVLIWNRAMEELTGLPAEDMLEQGDYAYALTFYNERRPVLVDLVLKPDPEYADRYVNYSRGGDLLVSEAILDDFRGRGRTWLWNIAGPLRDTDGKVIGAIESIRDVTNWRMLEEERARIESQFRQAQKMEAIGTLAGGIAHDFNNILSAIIGYSELLQMELSADREALSKIQEILKAGLRARDLVQQILTFSRKTDQERKPIQIDLIVDEALKLLRATLPSNIEIEKQLDSKSLIMGDPTQIHQVVMNLCTNAGHAMREDGGKLRVELYDAEVAPSTAAMHLAVEPGNYLNLVVSDTGSGIEPDVLERIFEPFFTTKARDEGTGMGLSVVHGIVTGLGGMIHAYSELGRGSTFSVFLPVLQSQGQNQAKKTDLSAYHGTETILVVDDEVVIAKVAAELLSSLGYRVEIRTDSQEALAYFKEHPRKFDLVIADVTMPALTGDRLAEQMLSINKDLPIILATGFSNRVSDEKVRELGVRAIMAKPFVLAKLAVAIRQALDGEQIG